MLRSRGAEEKNFYIFQGWDNLFLGVPLGKNILFNRGFILTVCRDVALLRLPTVEQKRTLQNQSQ
ncbi:MAG: hypothetical protein AAFR83_22275 [Cyanobacteria bacterium J06629_18]